MCSAATLFVQWRSPPTVQHLDGRRLLRMHLRFSAQLLWSLWDRVHVHSMWKVQRGIHVCAHTRGLLRWLRADYVSLQRPAVFGKFLVKWRMWHINTETKLTHPIIPTASQTYFLLPAVLVTSVWRVDGETNTCLALVFDHAPAMI